MKKWLLSALGIAAAVFLYAVSGQIGRIIGRTAVDSVQTANRTESVAEAQRKTAAELVSRLPMRVDEATVWTTVASDGATLVYGYEIDASHEVVDKSAFRDVVKKQVCGNAQMRSSMALGASYRYFYLSPSGAPLADLFFTSASCP